MEAFMNVEQYQFLKKQARKMINACSNTKDKHVIEAMQALVMESINTKIVGITDDKLCLLKPIVNLQTKEQLEDFFKTIKTYVTPFEIITEKNIKKLFPKDKKMNIPNLKSIDWTEISYLSWLDSGTNRKYIVFRDESGIIGFRGVFSYSNKKGFCTICNQHHQVGMFMSSKKGKALGTYVKRGNYICTDSTACNESLTDFTRLTDFLKVITE
ncbi:FusB/FusC family EF-G-binding protein [Viridibacillus sp. YIM B01967]|uniref:FusB/FusC family EF-G-binding protein n=1 Tax=Viridibacillus soli TaxID=2798301 RepID=A0ABS1HD74_9BACL|nr:FusB/FusC family EF-G-binding protein [Viridibacillus soli]MBK3497365.1 FusB/FusC family EF-G-binding protein [Viridibacillus soli]